MSKKLTMKKFKQFVTQSQHGVVMVSVKNGRHGLSGAIVKKSDGE